MAMISCRLPLRFERALLAKVELGLRNPDQKEYAMSVTTHASATMGNALMKGMFTVVLGIACFMMAPSAHAHSDADCGKPPQHVDCGQHNMMVVGEKAIFLSHLPMFMSEHRFQVILEVTFPKKNGQDLANIYTEDRKHHPETTMYTVEPVEKFVLPRLWTANGQPPQRDAFQSIVYRGHLERRGTVIGDLKPVYVHVTRVVYAKELQSTDKKSDTLEYLLFGKAPELFLAHKISQAPDFDQILAVTIDGHTFTEAELQKGVTVVIPDHENAPSQRIKAGATVSGQGHVTGAHQFLALQIQAHRELYFEEGELKMEPDFQQTAEERNAGF